MGKVLIVGNRSLGGSELAELIGERVASRPVFGASRGAGPESGGVCGRGRRNRGRHRPRRSAVTSNQDRRAAQEQLSFGLEWLGGLGARRQGSCRSIPTRRQRWLAWSTPRASTRSSCRRCRPRCRDGCVRTCRAASAARSPCRSPSCPPRPPDASPVQSPARRSAMSEVPVSGRFAHRWDGWRGCDERSGGIGAVGSSVGCPPGRVGTLGPVTLSP